MAITDKNSTSQISNDPKRNRSGSENSTIDTVQPEELKNYIQKQGDKAGDMMNQAKQSVEENPQVQEVEDKLRSMQEQAQSGMQEAADTVNGAVEEANEQFKSASEDGQSKTTVQSMQDQAQEMKQSMLNAGDSNNDPTNQAREKASEAFEGLGDAANAAQDAANHAAMDAKEYLTKSEQDKQHEEQSLVDDAKDAADATKEKSQSFLLSAKDEVELRKAQATQKDSKSSEKSNIFEDITGGAEQFRDELIAATQDDSTENESNDGAFINKECLEEGVEDGKEQAVQFKDEVVDLATNASETLNDVTESAKDSASRVANAEGESLLDTAMAKAEVGQTILAEQINQIKDNLTGNTAAAKENAAREKTGQAQERMSEAQTLLGDAVKDKKDALTMKAKKAISMESKSSQNKNGEGLLDTVSTTVEEGKGFAMDRAEELKDQMTGNTIEAKTQSAKEKQQRAEEMLKEAKAMTTEAAQDALQAMELRAKETANADGKA